ncbi:MAG TPA: type II toxin-antitoxin system VapC family toxin [Candidatus Dormibacteraeota bacterium]
MSSAARVDDAAVVDASALLDFLLGTDRGRAVGSALGRFAALHAPAHLDAEVLSALGRLHRAGTITAPQVGSRLEALTTAPIERHALTSLLAGAWRRRARFRLVDALYIELSEMLGAVLLTTDSRLASAAGIAAITP